MNDGNQGQACAQLELRQQIEEEQHVLLLPYALGAMVVLWLWYIVLAQNRVGQSQSGVMTRADGAVVILALGIAIILWARESHPATARWALILAGLAVVVVLRPALQPGLAMATAALWIVMASALVSTWQAGLAVGLLAATEWLIGLVAPPGSATGLAPVERIIVYALLFVAIWWAHHPLHTSVDRTLAAWAHASEALTEARSRRGELNRALHALEEATYRIEHTNSELLLARREAELAKARVNIVAMTMVDSGPTKWEEISLSKVARTAWSVYGGSRSMIPYFPLRMERALAVGKQWIEALPRSLVCSRFCSIIAQHLGSLSTKSAHSAPRLSASMPKAPVPA